MEETAILLASTAAAAVAAGAGVIGLGTLAENILGLNPEKIERFVAKTEDEIATLDYTIRCSLETNVTPAGEALREELTARRDKLIKQIRRYKPDFAIEE